MHMSSLKRAVSSDMQKLKNEENMRDREKEKTDWISEDRRKGGTRENGTGQGKTGESRAAQEGSAIKCSLG